jgi:tRNA A37 threonylcarbamoyladenosine biosynthesis protein TsaE
MSKWIYFVGICLIEWPEKLTSKKLLPDSYVDVNIAIQGNGCRHVTLSGTGAKTSWVQQINSEWK